MRLLIYGILARVQRDEKVILHHFVFEGSHPHIVCTAKDADQCQKFYGQIKKQLTDSVKRLLDLEHLSIWENRASVIEIPTLDDVVDKIAYLYSNPSNDDLESSIELYPGVSSWQLSSKAKELDYVAISEHPWIRQPMIPKLPKRSLTERQDKFISNKMLSASNKHHTLRVRPHSWIARFIDNPSTEDVQRIWERIVDRIRAQEADNAKRRVKKGKQVIGAKELKRQPLLKSNRPKKRGIKIFAQSQFKEIRFQLIEEIQLISALCRSAYERWKAGDFTAVWPPGTFPPGLPPLANAI